MWPQKSVGWYPTRGHILYSPANRSSRTLALPETPNPTSSVVPVGVTVCRALRLHSRLPLCHLGHHIHIGGVCCNRSQLGQHGVQSGAARRPVHANAHVPMSAEALQSFPQKFGICQTLPNPNFGRFGSSLVGRQPNSFVCRIGQLNIIQEHDLTVTALKRLKTFPVPSSYTGSDCASEDAKQIHSLCRFANRHTCSLIDVATRLKEISNMHSPYPLSSMNGTLKPSICKRHQLVFSPFICLSRFIVS